MADRMRFPGLRLRSKAAPGESGGAIWAPVTAVGTLVGGAAALFAWLWPDREPAPVLNGQREAAPISSDAPLSMMRQAANITANDDVELRQLVGRSLDRIASGATAAPGFVDGIARLQPGEATVWRVHLVAQSSYMIVGACDNECSNIDIELVDAAGRVVAGDTLPDNFPMVPYTPAASGAHDIRLVLQGCQLAPCYAGARVLSGG